MKINQRWVVRDFGVNAFSLDQVVIQLFITRMCVFVLSAWHKTSSLADTRTHLSGCFFWTVLLLSTAVKWREAFVWSEQGMGMVVFTGTVVVSTGLLSSVKGGTFWLLANKVLKYVLNFWIIKNSHFLTIQAPFPLITSYVKYATFSFKICIP